MPPAARNFLGVNGSWQYLGVRPSAGGHVGEDCWIFWENYFGRLQLDRSLGIGGYIMDQIDAKSETGNDLRAWLPIMTVGMGAQRLIPV